MFLTKEETESVIKLFRSYCHKCKALLCESTHFRVVPDKCPSCGEICAVIR